MIDIKIPIQHLGLCREHLRWFEATHEGAHAMRLSNGITLLTDECGKSDCEIAAWFYNSCGALAVGDDRTWAGAQHDSEQRARQIAQNDCVKEGGKNCKIVYSSCSR